MFHAKGLKNVGFADVLWEPLCWSVDAGVTIYFSSPSFVGGFPYEKS